MSSRERRINIQSILKDSDKPQKGHVLAERFGVTRQVIVKDIAILRAEGKNIIATPEGYMVPRSEKNRIRQVIAVYHNADEMQDELSTIIKFGAIVEDVTIEHSVYGEIKAMLMIKSLYDVENFILKIKETKSEPLLVLTGGVHLHTISADNYSAINNIKSELKNKGYLISD